MNGRSIHSTTNSPEPDIITGADDEKAPTTAKPRSRPLRPTRDQQLPKTAGGQSPYNMDALIIGIVGGVVAFIAIIIIIICIVRLRLTDTQYRGGPLAGPLALRAQGNNRAPSIESDFSLLSCRTFRSSESEPAKFPIVPILLSRL